MNLSLFGVTMSVWGWLLLSAGIVMVVIGRSQAADSGEDVGLMRGTGASRIGAIGWGITLAGIAYIMWLSYSATDAVNALQWAFGPGRVWAALGVVFYGGYIWSRVSGEVDDRRGMVDELREAVTAPILQAGGVISTILITVGVGLVTIAIVFGDILGFIIGGFAADPGFGAAVFTAVGGWISAGGSVPLVDPFIPAWARSVSPVGWLGFSLMMILIALSFRSANFREAVMGGS